MPVSTTPSTSAPQLGAALWKSTSTDGRAARERARASSARDSASPSRSSLQVHAGARETASPGAARRRRSPRRPRARTPASSRSAKRRRVAGRDVQHDRDRQREVGRAARDSRVSACGPPVEVPIDEHARLVARRDAAATAAAAARRGRPRTRAAAASTFATSSSPSSYSRSVASAVGLCTRSTAPACSAATPSSLSSSGHADHHHARRACRRQRREHAEAVEVRHHQIERHHVGLELGDLLERLEPVARDADDLDPRARRQRLAQHLARERRVVDDQHPDARRASSRAFR